MPDSAPNKSTTLFVEYLQQVGAGEDVDFDAFCAQHPDHADGLRDRKRFQDDLDAIMVRVRPGSLSERIKERYGEDADPEISLKGEPEGSTDLGTELIERLSARGEGYGRYRLKGEIDRGGQGAILRVWDEDLRRSLAMKVMLGQVEVEPSGDTPPVDSKTLGRFLEEAQVTGQLDHPGIVPVHELGLDGKGRVYFTMKLVKGESLAVIFNKVKTGQGGWTQTRALGVLLKVCEAMAYAHDKGVIHRDLKPANIMVGRFGEAYVMDWGLARVMGRKDERNIRIKPLNTTADFSSERREHADSPDSPLITMDGDVVGTPAFMSPEQASGNLGLIGTWSDVYSLGAMLYQLLAGHCPYVPSGVNVNNYAVWQRVQEGPPPPLATYGQAPRELEAICDKAMARSVKDRYTTTLDLETDLRAYLENRVVGAYRSGLWPELKKWISRNRPLAVALAALGLALLTSFYLGMRSIIQASYTQELEDANQDVREERRKIAEKNVRLEESYALVRRQLSVYQSSPDQSDPEFMTELADFLLEGDSEGARIAYHKARELGPQRGFFGNLTTCENQLDRRDVTAAKKSILVAEMLLPSSDDPRHVFVDYYRALSEFTDAKRFGGLARSSQYGKARLAFEKICAQGSRERDERGVSPRAMSWYYVGYLRARDLLAYPPGGGRTAINRFGAAREALLAEFPDDKDPAGQGLVQRLDADVARMRAMLGR